MATVSRVTPSESTGPAESTVSAESMVSVGQNSSLRHVLVVGGTLGEWAALSPAAWKSRVETLGAVCDRVGVPWLTIRAYERGVDVPDGHQVPWRHTVGRSQVIIDPCGDGRQRFADAMAQLDPDDEVNEASVASILYEPADSEPDLVVVLGPPTQLPPSLVWELAYAELVFVDVAWCDLLADHLAGAIHDFSNRRRRFGGLDDEED
jgi:undecaprenyl diphosphate synthase